MSAPVSIKATSVVALRSKVPLDGVNARRDDFINTGANIRATRSALWCETNLASKIRVRYSLAWCSTGSVRRMRRK